MKSFLLLVLTLLTGCEVSSEKIEEIEVTGCRGGWVDFTCSYPEPNRHYEAVGFKLGPGNVKKSNISDQWKHDSRFSLFHNTTRKALRVIIRNLQNDDKGKYKCLFYKEIKTIPDNKDKIIVKLEIDEDVCQKPVNETAYINTVTNITCKYPDDDSSYDKFFCKESGSICDDISSNQMFNLTKTKGQLTVSINQMSSQHQGVYWCGLRGESFRAGVRKITINDIPTFTFSLSVRETFTHKCVFPNGAPVKKFICKGEDPHVMSCQRLISTTPNQNSSRKFSFKFPHDKHNITFTVREVAAEDSGTYWCGAESSTGKHRDWLYQRLNIQIRDKGPGVTSTSTSTSSSSSTSSTQKTAPPNLNEGSSPLTVIIPAVCAAVLVLSLLLLLVYKRTGRSKHSTNGEAHNQKEEQAYEEIQERPQKPDSGTALKTIYTTATFPTIPSAPQEYYSTIFTNPSAIANNDTYSTVRDAEQIPAHSAVNHPSRLPEDPFYSTLGNPQQQ